MPCRAANARYETAAKLAGVGHSTVAAILFGRRGKPPRERIRPQTAAAILAVPLRADVADGQLVDAATTWRRVRSLIALGYPRTFIAAQIGSGGKLQLGKRVVTARLQTAVKRLYDQIGDTPAPPGAVASRARAEAARKGWLPPAGWDDDDDFGAGTFPAAGLDPGELIDELVVERAVLGERQVGMTKAERSEALRQMHAAGRSTSEIARALRLSGTTVRGMLSRLEDHAVSRTA